MIWFIINILCHTRAKETLYVLYYNLKWYIFAFRKEIVMYCNKKKAKNTCENILKIVSRAFFILSLEIKFIK